MHRHILKVVGVIALLGVGTFATAASFDCRKASTDIEKVICDDPELSRLDSEMGRLYHKAKNIPGMKTEQKAWVHHRNSLCGSSDGCLIGETKNRIFVLKKALKSSGSTLHSSSSVYSPDLGIICDKKSGFCADSEGISLGYTKDYLGEEQMNRWLKHLSKKGFDKTRFTFSNGIYCDTPAKKCYTNKYKDAVSKHWTQKLFSHY